MSNYTIKITKLSHYVGNHDSEFFKKGQITKEEYNYYFEDFSNAIDDYKLKCSHNANNLCMAIAFFQNFTIQLIDNSQDRIMFHFHCNNL